MDERERQARELLEPLAKPVVLQYMLSRAMVLRGGCPPDEWEALCQDVDACASPQAVALRLLRWVAEKP